MSRLNLHVSRRLRISATRLGGAMLAAGLFVAANVSARAAELRVSLGELTGLVQSIAADAKLYLNSVPAGLFSSPSYVTISGTQQYPVPIPAKSFTLLGGTYTYFISDVASTSIKVTPISGALRLTMRFEGEGPEAVAGCLAGSCTFEGALPDIQWDNAVVNVDFVPIRFNGSISLQVKAVSTEGRPRAVCKPGSEFLQRTACTLGLPFANRTVSTLKADLPRLLRDAVNQPDVQAQFAEGLKRFLTLGTTGNVAITSIVVDPKNLNVGFGFALAGAAKGN